MKSLSVGIRDHLATVLPLKTVIKLQFYTHHGRFPRLSPPVTFSEKIAHRKIYDRNPLMPKLADKLLAKQYVADALGSDWVIPTLWSGTELPPRSERNWPIPYVLKASHGSGWNAFVFSEEDQDWDRIEAQANQWVSTIYGKRSREWVYSQMTPTLLVEPFMGTRNVAPPDYKFFVFGGKTAYVQVDLGRLQTHRQFFYDPEWNRQTFTYICPFDPDEIEPPKSLSKMLAAADLLGKPFPFVRVDLYEIEGQPMFGEFTFYPNSGLFAFHPDSIELHLGQLWRD